MTDPPSQVEVNMTDVFTSVALFVYSYYINVLQ